MRQIAFDVGRIAALGAFKPKLGFLVWVAFPVVAAVIEPLALSVHKKAGH